MRAWRWDEPDMTAGHPLMDLSHFYKLIAMACVRFGLQPWRWRRVHFMGPACFPPAGQIAPGYACAWVGDLNWEKQHLFMLAISIPVLQNNPLERHGSRLALASVSVLFVSLSLAAKSVLPQKPNCSRLSSDIPSAEGRMVPFP